MRGQKAESPIVLGKTNQKGTLELELLIYKIFEFPSQVLEIAMNQAGILISCLYCFHGIRMSNGPTINLEC